MSEPVPSSGDSEKKVTTTPADTSKAEGVHTPPEPGANPPVEDVKTPSKEAKADNDSLDFKGIFSVPSTKEERGGDSRRKFAKEHKPKTPAVEKTDGEDEDSKAFDDLKNILREEIKSEYKEEFESLKSVKARFESEDKRRLEDSFQTTLEENGISINDFNTKYKEEFEAKKKFFLEKKMAGEDAVMSALEIISSKYKSDKKVEEVEHRANGRSKARTTPQSTIKLDQATYTMQELSKLPQKEYNRIKDMVEQGKARILK